MNSRTSQDSVSHQEHILVERMFKRFTVGQRWEHWLLFLSVLTLLLTGLPQKYRVFSLSQQILSSPERLELVRQIHHIAAIVLILEVIYHLVHNIYLMFRRRLPGDMFPTLRDISDVWQMIKYLLFLKKEVPPFSKYSFEQKFTYWFLFLTVAVMVVSGLVIWFPLQVTRVFPGGIVPAAKLAHSTEAVVAAIFILIWHIFHVLIHRINLSMFTGKLSEQEMRRYHQLEYERLSGVSGGESQPDSSGDDA